MLCRNIGIIQHGELVENTSTKALLGKLESETFILDLGSKNPLPQLEGYTFRLTTPQRWRWMSAVNRAERCFCPAECAEH